MSTHFLECNYLLFLYWNVHKQKQSVVLWIRCLMQGIISVATSCQWYDDINKNKLQCSNVCYFLKFIVSFVSFCEVIKYSLTKLIYFDLQLTTTFPYNFYLYFKKNPFVLSWVHIKRQQQIIWRTKEGLEC